MTDHSAIERFIARMSRKHEDIAALLTKRTFETNPGYDLWHRRDSDDEILMEKAVNEESQGVDKLSYIVGGVSTNNKKRKRTKTAEGGEPFTYFANVTFGVICFIWLLATIFCTPVGRWLRCANLRARRPFYYNPARAAGDEEEPHELDELVGDSGRRNGRARRVIDVNDMRSWREGALGSGSSTTAEYEFEL